MSPTYPNGQGGEQDARRPRLPSPAPRPEAKYHAAIIGRTGRGDYGHDLDRAWAGHPDVAVVAIADEEESGRRQAMERAGISVGYADYREMLAEVRPEFVSVGPRWVDCHAEMMIACAEAGVKGILCEKPFTRTPAEADAVLEACRRSGTRIAVAHQARVMPQVRQAVELIRGGEIGRVHLLAAHGKGDHRGGGEDMAVLGTHVLDLMHLIAGEPEWVSARVQVEGRDITPADVREGGEGLGLLAGDGITAMYAFPEGITGAFESHRGQGHGGRRFGVEVYGSLGTIALRAGEGWAVLHAAGGACPSASPVEWTRLPEPGWAEAPRKLAWGNQLLARDLVAAVEEGRDPVSPGADGRWAVEMIAGVYASQLTGARVAFPLVRRHHPLAGWA